MANEATITTLLGNQGDVIEWNVNTATAIPKGSLMAVGSSPQTAVISAPTSTGQIFAGIAAVEKSATNTDISEMPCITHCIAEMTTTAGGSAVLGEPVKLYGTNAIGVADLDTVIAGTEVVGVSRETLSTTATGSIHVNVGKRR